MSIPHALPQTYDPYVPPSDKSKVTAGLLQLVPGALLVLGGIGRLYAGHIGVGVLQLFATMVGWVCFWCGFVLYVPWFITGIVWLWFVLDGIGLLVGRSTDGRGRPLR